MVSAPQGSVGIPIMDMSVPLPTVEVLVRVQEDGRESSNPDY